MRDEQKHEWDRQPGESSKAYGHFTRYRDLGQERSLRKLAADAKTKSRLRQLQHWSSRWEWVERCQQYDDYLDQQARVEQEKERRDMMRRHAKIAVLGQNAVVKGIEKLLAEIEHGKRNPTASDLSRLLDVAVRVERLSRGQPTEISELGSVADRPLRVSLEERARAAIEGALGITEESPTSRTEPDGAEAEAAQTPGGDDAFSTTS